MEIPSKYNAKEVEEKNLKKWLGSECFSAKASSKAKAFSIVIPPPNITGILHMGHALNNTIQDVLIRFNRMRGLESLWMPGTDHAGIATQNVVEKALAKEGLRKEDIGRDKFTERLWEWRDQYGSTIIDQLKKLGASCDWPRTRFTMDEDYSEAVKETFVKLYDKGLIYRGNYIINWCPRCETALSDEESPHNEIDGWLYYLKYPVDVGAGLAQPSKEHKYIVVATTRPETMLGDTAVAINPKDKRYQYLKGAKVILPIVERELKVIEDEAIDPEFGTGIVKVTPAHDPVDFMLGKKHDLEFINIMNADSTLNRNVPDDFIGMDRFEAREALLEILGAKKLIEKREPYKISAGHCYRCHTIIEPRISLQWFVKMKPLAQKAIQVVEQDKVKFYPTRWKKVYLNWMYNIQDWCISRQIWWGHRIPVYYCQDCKGEADHTRGVIVSKEKPLKCPDCKGINLAQDRDVLDTWFSSWLWPFATLGWPFGETKDEGRETKDERRRKKAELKYFYPTDVLVTASEILFFWVARMIMSGLEFMGKIPFKDVMIHGTVRDDKGIKMSKSLGNTIDPLEIIDEFGADALRFSLMLLAASGSDIYLSNEKFIVGRNFSNKIWNAARFLLLKIKDSDFTIDDIKLDKLDSLDKWVLVEFNQAIDEISAYLDDYRLNEATKRIYDFFWHVFCDWYIEIAKDQFTKEKAKVVIYLLINSMKLLHPIMPFITEEIYQIIKDNTSLSLDESIVKSAWPQKLKIKTDKQEAAKVNALIDTIKEIRNIKADLGLQQKKIKLMIEAQEKAVSLWQENKAWILRLTVTQDIVFIKKMERQLYENDLWKINFDIESADLSSFMASLDKKIDHLDNALGKVSGKLRNQGFVKSAPAQVVEKEKMKLSEMTNQINRLKSLKEAFK